jgi:hypothetical protein
MEQHTAQHETVCISLHCSSPSCQLRPCRVRNEHAPLTRSGTPASQSWLRPKQTVVHSQTGVLIPRLRDCMIRQSPDADCCCKQHQRASRVCRVRPTRLTGRGWATRLSSSPPQIASNDTCTAAVQQYDAAPLAGFMHTPT